MDIDMSVTDQPIRGRTTAYYAATYNGGNEFYTGLTNGERVLLQVSTQIYTDTKGDVKASVSLSCQKREGSAWMSLYNHTDKISDLKPWTDEIHGL